jgi:repressor LexA
MGRKRQFSREHVVSLIQQWRGEHGLPPTIKELQKLLKVGSTRTVMRYLRWLEAEGDIERGEGARSIRVRRGPMSASMATKAVPIVGTAPAGALMTAEQNVDGWIRLPQAMLPSGDGPFFLLHVRGNSMNRAENRGVRIESGDLVLVRQQVTANPGDIVVALIDGEATIKRLRRAGGHWVLNPESTESKHHPIMLGPSFRVQGVVVRVIKRASELTKLIEG